MHSLTMIAAGLIALAIFIGVAHFAAQGDRARMARAAILFIPLWLVAAIANLLVGVFRAGVPLSVEIPVLAAVFGVPALAAWLASKRLAPA